MTKDDFVSVVALEADITKKKAKHAVDAVFDLLKREILETKKVTIHGFGTWALTTRAEKKGRNPRTGEAMIIPAAPVVRWRIAEAFKKELKQPKAN